MAKIDGNKLTPQSKALHIFEPDSNDYSDRLWEFFSFISLAERGFLENLYQQLEQMPKAFWQSKLVDIGRAKFRSVTGNLFMSYSILGTTKSDISQHSENFPDHDTYKEIKAFLSYEQAILGEKIRDLRIANEATSIAKDLAGSKNLQMAVELFATRLRVIESKWKIDTFIEMVRKVEAAGLLPLACMGWRMAGIIARKQGLKSESIYYTDKALEIASTNEFKLLQYQVIMSQAVSASTWGDHDLAREHINLLSSRNPDAVHQAVINEVLAVMLNRENKTDAAVDLVKQALVLTTKLDHITMVPDESLFLGEQFENHYNDLDQAEHYYQIGYEHAIRYAEHGISLSGDRKKVVDAYLRVLKKKRKTTGVQRPAQPDQFSFAEGKSWKRIKDIFHHQLILYHATELPNRKQMAKKLDMPPTTLYSVQNRLESRGYLLPAKGQESSDTMEQLQDFIEDHDALSWIEINEIFEREMMHYLYEKYGYNKQRMATILELSYPALLNKTRELTQVDDHLLPN